LDHRGWHAEQFRGEQRERRDHGGRHGQGCRRPGGGRLLWQHLRRCRLSDGGRLLWRGWGGVCGRRGWRWRLGWLRDIVQAVLVEELVQGDTRDADREGAVDEVEQVGAA